jgi:UDP-glucose 4-epimerase
MVGEHYLRAYERNGINHTIFRLFNVVGPDIDRIGKGRAISRMVGSGLHATEIPVVLPGTQTRCFCHVKDAVDLLVRPTFFKKPSIYTEHGGKTNGADWAPSASQTVNVGNPDEIAMIDLAKLIAIEIEQKLGRRPLIVKYPAKDIFGDGYDDMMRRVPSVRRAFDIFGWGAKTTLMEIIDEYIDNAIKEAGWTGRTKTSA